MKQNRLILLSFMCSYTLSSCEKGETPRDRNIDFESDTVAVPPDPEPGTDSATDPGYNKIGICGVSSDGSVTRSSFLGFEDTYLIGDEGDGADICRVRFTIRNVGVPTVPCNNCDWSFTVEKSEPTILADVDAGCAESELQLSAKKIDTETGRRFSIGYAAEDTGHAHVLLRLNESTGMWEAISVASWNEETGLFFYDRKDGFCAY